MSERDYAAELYNKMSAEQDKYRAWLLAQPPEEILNHAYEYVVREDILCEVEMMEIEQKQAKALLKSPCPVADVLKDFEKVETGYMETIRETIENRADKLIKQEKEREAR